MHNYPKDSNEFVSKKDIEQMLISLSKSDPKNLAPVGAMCYKVAATPDRIEYICPVCGEKTLYTSDIKNIYQRNFTKIIYEDLQQMRQIVSKMPKIDCVLDESQLCKKCSPDVENPDLCLIIKIKDEKLHKTCNISLIDIELLYEFLSGQEIHRTKYDKEEPLKNYQNRIEELLGM